MKLAVATRADKNIEYLSRMTHPIIKKFSAKWGADFIVLDSGSPCNVDLQCSYNYRIMKLHDLLGTYDRILSLDTDIVINKNCPNLFEVVPPEKIGSMITDKQGRPHVETYWKAIQDIQEKWGNVNWTKGMVNTGVFVVSRPHREIFRSGPDGTYWTGHALDDTHLSWMIHRDNLQLFELDYRYNHICVFSEPWFGSKNRFDSFIIHHAGGQAKKERLIREDIGKIWSSRIYEFGEYR